jgi:hypothetical protein
MYLSWNVLGSHNKYIYIGLLRRRSRKSKKDRQRNIQRKQDKEWSTKHYTEN